ncbi:MAG: hypothetical protein LBE92_05455 [Chryseobacterium sp.]|uniref:hypothetical protein n=1 Tax=Chryseobacterium sp. TaxID=1871047 RepID=UPI002833864C|nr:hypothetical protein [Chryseobacterium sp.]MDR2235548.1 hypothetical protein [Chryseobacterium sp.]
MKNPSTQYQLLFILLMISTAAFSQKIKQDTMVVWNKKIIIKAPAVMGNGSIETENVLEVERKGNTEILKFNAVSNGSSSWLYMQDKGNKICITKELSYSNGIYKKELTKNDFDYLPATQVCVKERSVKVDKSISVTDFFKFKPVDCYQCPINISVEDCIKNGNKKYRW